jgi:hypothetical protein
MEKLRDVLLEHGGYQRDHVLLLSDEGKDRKNPSVGNFFNELQSFLQQPKAEDSVLVAFSGHGDSDDDHTYLLPIDAVPGLLKNTAVSMATFHEFLQQCPARQKIIFLDACHSWGQKGDDENPFDPDKWPQGDGLLEIFSCDKAESSWEDAKIGQGVFSYFLARAIQGEADIEGNRDGYVTSDEVYDYVYKHTRAYARDILHRTQNPKLRGEVKGKIILAARSKEQTDSGLKPEEIASLLKQLRDENKISTELLDASQAWLRPSELAVTTRNVKSDNRKQSDANPDFGPARDVQLGLSLLAQSAMTEEEFKKLCGDKCRQLASHNAAENEFRRRRIRAICIGINRYGGGNDLAFAVSDADFLAEKLRECCGADAEKLVELTNEQATVSAFDESLRAAMSGLSSRDLLFISFAGRGFQTGDRTGWGFSNGKSDVNATAGAPGHRGFDLESTESAGSNAALMPMRSLELRLKAAKCDVIVCSDACWAAPTATYNEDDEADTEDLSESKREESPSGARVFVYTSNVDIEDRVVKHGLITYVVARALSGLADKDTPVEFRAVKDPSAARCGVSDGYVSLSELVRFCRQNGTYQGRDVINVKARIGNQDAVVARSALLTE